LLAWLRCVLRNNLANARQYHHTQKRDLRREVGGADGQVAEVPDSGKSPSAQVRDREQGEEVQRALQRLPERARQAIVLRLWDNLTFAQVGEQLGCSEEAACKLFQRAAVKLGPLLESLRDEA
jgi:RNA polymerase sigma factor (sigma-70 family)